MPEQTWGQAFGLATTGMMTLQGLAVAGAGALAELLPPPSVIVICGAASLAATVLLWRHLSPR